ncbi:MAG: PP2C family protein-serine/threonine phosphatase [bacterium]
MNSKNHRYWLAAGFIIILLIAILYPKATYESLSMKITRNDAIDLAKKYLVKQGIDLSGFREEAFIDNSPIEIKYLLKSLGREKFKEYQKNKRWSNLSWSVMFHLNLPRQIDQEQYFVDVSNDGRVFGFTRTLPDTMFIKSITKPEATELMKSFLSKEIGEEFNEYNLAESREENFSKRSDYSFRWEKKEKTVKGKIVITGNIRGNTIGGYNHYFEVPQEQREFIDTGEALYGTVSVIFVVFLIFIAFYQFLKKYHEGEVWVSVGRRLFVIFFGFNIISLINIWPGIGQGVTIGSVSFLYIKIIIIIANGLLVTIFLGMLVFAGWTVGESYGRTLWSDKLKGMDSFINGHLFSIQSGSSLLKGFVIGAGLAFSYLLGDIILSVPNSFIFLNPSNTYSSFISYLPAVQIFTDAFTTALLASIAVTFFIVNITYQRWKKKWISILISGFVTVLVFTIASTPPSLNNFMLNLVSGFLFGCFTAYIFFMFDLLTLVSMHFNALVIYNCYALCAADNPFYTWNLIALIVILLACPVIYLISLVRKEEFVLENFGLPSHVKRISERERLRKEMEIAAKVQLSLLPKEEPNIPGYDIASTSLPALEAGGDYFDFVKLSGDKIGIAIGDVSGKGVGAAIYMTLTKGILQAHAEESISPKLVLNKVNRLLYKTMEKNSFVSMCYCILNTKTNEIIYSRAGHNPAILCTFNDKNSKLLLSKGIALGLEEGEVFSKALTEESVTLGNGDIMVLYTDGFTEAMNERKEMFGEQKLKELVEGNRQKSARDMLNLILKEVKKFADNYPQNDDMTIVIIKKL